MQLDEITTLEKIVREQAIHDALTDLYNRRYLAECMQIEFSRAQRNNHPVAFLLLDLDHFKEVNDTYGHQTGDHVLQIAAQAVAAQIRRSDIAFRFGGEEFMIIMPEINRDDALLRAEHLCQVIDELQIEYEQKTIHITVSIGVAVYPTQGKNGDEILFAADSALYRAKNAGRNKVVLYQ
jgi:diguanylate cyclase (GGDEF)-like protein